MDSKNRPSILANMIQLRKSQERGHVSEDWLDTYHTFSFSNYYDPRFMGFRSLRVINEDRVAPAEGFPTHPHDNMEIVTYIVDGALEHRDSMGTGSVIRPGDIQRMSAGTGITHSEFNHSKEKPCHLLQIWILPEKEGIQPEYEQRFYEAKTKLNQLKLIVSPKKSTGDAVKIHQDVKVYSSLLEAGHEVSHEMAKNRHAWLQLVRGKLTVNGQSLAPGDGLAASEEPKLTIRASEDAEFLLFDLN